MTLRQYKKIRRNIAKQLGYVTVMPDVVNKINSAESEIAVDRIMTTARHKMGDVQK